MESTSRGEVEMDQTKISGHNVFFIYDDYKSPFSKSGDSLNKSNVFFSTGNKIFEISYRGDEITPVIKEIIKSSPKSKMSEESFLNKLDNAQKAYVDEDFQKNLELDLEEFYRDYNDEHDWAHFSYWDRNGYHFGSIHRM